MPSGRASITTRCPRGHPTAARDAHGAKPASSRHPSDHQLGAPTRQPPASSVDREFTGPAPSEPDPAAPNRKVADACTGNCVQFGDVHQFVRHLIDQPPIVCEANDYGKRPLALPIAASALEQLGS